MTKLVIFDLDGTLLNTLTDMAVSVNYALTECGFPTHDEDAYRLFVGDGIDRLFERALPPADRTQANITRMRDIFLPYYTVHKSDFTRPYAGLTELLERLQDRGMKLAVASNKYHAGTVAVVEKQFPTIQFDVVLGQRDGVTPTPSPQVIYDILDATGCELSEAIFVGDSGVDMLTGRNACIRTIGVAWGFRSIDELITDGANQVVQTAAELEDVIFQN